MLILSVNKDSGSLLRLSENLRNISCGFLPKWKHTECRDIGIPAHGKADAPEDRFIGRVCTLRIRDVRT